MTRLFAALVALGLSASPAMAGQLRPIEVGRFAHFLDLDSVRRVGSVATLRYLLVPAEDFEAGGERFWGGWNSLTLDCAARTADLTGFQSVREGGAEGPKTVDTRPGWPIAPSSLEAALADAVCDGGRPLDRPDVTSLDEACGWDAADSRSSSPTPAHPGECRDPDQRSQDSGQNPDRSAPHLGPGIRRDERS